MKIILAFLILSFGTVLGSEISEKETIRRLFYFSIQSTDTLKQLEKHLKEFNNRLDKNFILAYNGAYLTLVAKHSFNPYIKYFRLKDGLNLLGSSIKNQPENLEYRFLRLSVLNYVPSFLGFDKIFLEDSQKIIELLMRKDFSEVNKNTQKGIIEFLLKSPKVTENQKKILRKIYNEF